MTTNMSMATGTEEQAPKDGRTYVATLSCVAPYPLNWDTTAAETFDSLEAAMAKADEWMKKYPKGIASRTRWIDVRSYAGIREERGAKVEVGRKVHLNTKKKRTK